MPVLRRSQNSMGYLGSSPLAKSDLQLALSNVVRYRVRVFLGNSLQDSVNLYFITMLTSTNKFCHRLQHAHKEYEFEEAVHIH